MRNLVLAFVLGLFLASCVTVPTGPIPPPPPPPAPEPAAAQQVQISSRRTDPLQIVRPLIPPPPDSNHWAILSFPAEFSSLAVYQRNSLLPAVSWSVCTNASTNSIVILLNSTNSCGFFMAVAKANGSVMLAWNPVSSPLIAGYSVYYGGASGSYTNKISAGTSTNVLISGLIPGAMYYFAATTYNTNGMESPFSAEISYLLTTNSVPVKTTIVMSPIVPAVTVLSATNVVSTNATVRGQVVSTGGGLPVTMFFYGVVDAVANTNGYWTSIAVAGTSTNLVSMKLTGLLPNTEYYYVFAALNAAGLSVARSDLSFTTKASPALFSPRAQQPVLNGPAMQRPQTTLPPKNAAGTNWFFKLYPPTQLRLIN